MTAFVFVDNSNGLDDASKSQIRRHVAIGKNAGRKLQRPSRKQPPPRLAALDRMAKKDKHGKSDDDGTREDGMRPTILFELLQVDRAIGDCTGSANLPVQVPLTDRQLLHQAVKFMEGPKHAQNLSKVVTSAQGHGALSRLIFYDQAYYHCALAIALQCSTRSRTDVDDLVVVHHLNRAVHMVNSRLHNPTAITDGTLAVALVMSSYESTRGRYELQAIHVAGLLTMINLRGGLVKFGKELPMFLVKLFRIDLDLAFRSGNPSQLAIEVFEHVAQVRKSMRPGKIPATEQTAHTQIQAQVQGEAQDKLDSTLTWIWHTTAVLCDDINKAYLGEPKLHSYWLLKQYILLGHHLVRYAPLRSAQDIKSPQRIAYLGLVLLISSFICGLDLQVHENPLITDLIRDEAEQSLLQIDPAVYEVHLWVLFLAAATNLQDLQDCPWLVKRLGEMMEILELHTWEDTKKILTKYLWINHAFEEKASNLFHSVRSNIYSSHQFPVT